MIRRNSSRRLPSAVVGLVLAMALGGCGSPAEPALITIAIPTAPPGDACLDALITGRVVADERWGIALQVADGHVNKVLWPNGYRGVQDGTRIAVVDGGGRVVAEVGDTIESGGGFVGPNGDPDNTTLLCGRIKLVKT